MTVKNSVAAIAALRAIALTGSPAGAQAYGNIMVLGGQYPGYAAVSGLGKFNAYGAYANPGYGYDNGIDYPPSYGSGYGPDGSAAYPSDTVGVAGKFNLSDTIDVSRGANNRVTLRWRGDPKPVARIRFFLLDGSRSEIAAWTVNHMPAAVTFTKASAARFYRVDIRYIGGSTRTIVSPL